ncbi:MAG: DedA family protein [Sphingobium sp.]|uniref:DedA family protein n=1 Tax=Sphingobium sp. TaxID=1912891 RepID=UPI0029BAA32A|nr:DedA family protein [Sphingobium sp.]MDX3910294.1 DedA family protein [Sphingobium sp.]
MTDWVLHLIDAGGYWGIWFLMVLENVFPPIPSELIMGIGGIRVGQGRMEMVPLLLAGTAGTTIGNYFWYLVGARLGVERLRPLVERHGRWATLEWCDVEALNRLFARYGQAIVFVFRFMPALRTMVSLPAGLFRMGHVRFLLWTGAGALIWNVILAYAGFILGSNFKEIDKYIGPAATATVAIAVIFYLYRLITWRPSAPRQE